MKITRLGLDLAKNVIQLHAVNARNEVMVRKAFSRMKLMTYMQALEPCSVGMEACAGAIIGRGVFQRWDIVSR